MSAPGGCDGEGPRSPYLDDRRAFYSASTTLCVSASKDQEVGLALGAGEARIREVVTVGGFGEFQRVSETPFNLVFEARP